MTLAFAGTSPFAADILDGLLDGCEGHAGREVVLVISQPDRPAGRGKKVRSPAVAERARERGLRLVQPERTHDDDMLALYAELGVDTIVVAAFGQMIREPLLTDFLMLNVHGSLLPAYRGAAPVERAIMDGLDHTGVGIMRMEAGLDTGPVAHEGRVDIAIDDDAGDVYAGLAREGIRLLHVSLDEAAAGTLTFREQPADGATYAHKITSADRALAFDVSARAAHDRVRALSPHIGAHVTIGGQRLGVWRTRLVDVAVGAGADVGASDELAARVAGVAGAVAHDSSTLMLGCTDGAVEVVELQPPGKRRMAAADWLRGLREPLAGLVDAPVVPSGDSDANPAAPGGRSGANPAAPAPGGG